MPSPEQRGEPSDAPHLELLGCLSLSAQHRPDKLASSRDGPDRAQVRQVAPVREPLKAELFASPGHYPRSLMHLDAPVTHNRRATQAVARRSWIPRGVLGGASRRRRGPVAGDPGFGRVCLGVWLKGTTNLPVRYRRCQAGEAAPQPARLRVYQGLALASQSRTRAAAAAATITGSTHRRRRCR